MTRKSGGSESFNRFERNKCSFPACVFFALKSDCYYDSPFRKNRWVIINIYDVGRDSTLSPQRYDRSRCGSFLLRFFPTHRCEPFEKRSGGVTRCPVAQHFFHIKARIGPRGEVESCSSAESRTPPLSRCLVDK
jgi:hypothetical protein